MRKVQRNQKVPSKKRMSTQFLNNPSIKKPLPETLEEV